MATVVTPGGRIGDDASLDRSPKQNWVEKRGGLPKYVRIVANALVRSGHNRSKAIQMAIGAMKRWARGGGNVSPKVQAAAAAAVAQWEAMKATTASAGAYPDYDIEVDLSDVAITAALAAFEEHLGSDEGIVAAAAALEAHLDETDTSNTELHGDEMTLQDGIYEEVVDDASDFASALLAGAAPLHPPAEWFENPQLDKLTPLSLTADGRIFGHVADWNMNHIGIPGARKPPRSMHNYAFFKTGVLQTAEGTDVPVGQITLAGGHASLNATAGQAVKHYDDTATAFADVTVGEDQFGVWVSGAIRPGVSDSDIRAIRASAPSGDWRPINGALELVAICQVNVPGFPIARGMVASGELVSLVAAGAGSLYALRQENEQMAMLLELESRITKMEDRTEHAEALAASAAPGDGDSDPDGKDDDVDYDDTFEIEPDDEIDDKDEDKEEEAEAVTAASDRMSRLDELRARAMETKKMELNRRMARVRSNC